VSGSNSPQRRHRRAQHRHRLRVFRAGLEEVHQLFGQGGFRRELFLEPLQLGGRRQLTVPEQIHDFLEGRLADQLAYVIAAVHQLSLLTVDKANFRAQRDNVFKSGFKGRHSPKLLSEADSEIGTAPNFL